MSVVAEGGYLRNLSPITLRCISARSQDIDGPGRPAFLYCTNGKDMSWNYETDVKPPIPVPSPYTFIIKIVVNYTNNEVDFSTDANRLLRYDDRFVLQWAQGFNLYLTALTGTDLDHCDCTVVAGHTNRVILTNQVPGNADNARQIWTAQRCPGTIAPDSQNRILVGEIINIVSNKGRSLNLGNCVCNFGGFSCTIPTKRMQFYPPNGTRSWLIRKPECPNGRVVNGICVRNPPGTKNIPTGVWIGIGVGSFLLLVIIGIVIWLALRRKPSDVQLIPIIVDDQITNGL